MPSDEAMLRQILDKEAIRDVLLKYTRGMDRCDDAIMAQSYHKDAREDHVDYVGPALEFIECARIGHQSHFDGHSHYITNQSIELDGDIAHVESYFLAALWRKAGPAQMVGGRYVDRVERRSGQWGIVRRACIVEWQGELNDSLHKLQQDGSLRSERNRDDISYLRPLELRRPDQVPKWRSTEKPTELINHNGIEREG